MIKRLPKGERESKLEQASAEMRARRDECDPGRLHDLRRDLEGRIAFLKSITPRKPGDSEEREVGRFVVRGGEVVQGEAEADQRVASSVLSWEDAYKKHYQLMRRQYFGRTPPKHPEPL